MDNNSSKASEIQSDLQPYVDYMEEAIRLAKQAEDLGEVPIGAVVVRDGEIIGRGYNRREIDGNPLGHAELMAISEAAEKLGGWRLEQCQLIVTLEPCPMCAGAIIQARIQLLIYGAKDPKAGYAGSLYNTLQDQRLNHQTEIIHGVCQEECQELLQSFFRRLRAQKKEHKAQMSSQYRESGTGSDSPIES
ncbi:tRNA adenosine(34) deaminase TadA [Bacillus horti]|uniref:tRNA-specific adenosine deaminase n=1 Tax=Caldalkalibacillus horti TaxID=77523 RepID=A0ABT9W2R7_9BACI|nr:tRNA adenosine(34) deaminase TadA [Bacillus horti]MDQ0167543.1 tRNA(adenine34) deaminase [Bacillus horti]